MKNKIIIAFWAIILFIFLATGIFNYYIVTRNKDQPEKCIEKIVECNDLSANIIENKLKIYNKITSSYDEYVLKETSYKDIKISTKDIIKSVSYKCTNNINKYDFPQKIEYSDGTLLYISAVMTSPNYKKNNSWHDKLESHLRIYDNLPNADMANIPKEIYFNNINWYLLTDNIKFNKILDNYNCIVPYYSVKRVEECKRTIESYNVDVVYKGKLTEKSGNVHLKYKLTNDNSEEMVISVFSNKLLFLSIIILMIVILLFILFKSKIQNHKRD